MRGYRLRVRISSRSTRVSRLPLALAVSTALASTLVAPVTAPAAAAPPYQDTSRRIGYQQWTSTKQLDRGLANGVKVVKGSLRMAQPIGTRRYDDPFGHPTKTYDFGRWTSRWTSPGFGFTELVASWQAATPRDSWIQVEARGRSETGRLSSWDTLARWSAGDARFHRTSLGEQGDDLARVATDTWRSNYSMGFTDWQLRLTLFRRSGTTASPVVHTLGAMTSRLPEVQRVVPSSPGVARGVSLTLPRYSQMMHEGDYPQYDAGGEAWCSPTSVSMVLGYYDRLPSAAEYAWVKSPHPNRFVDHAARMTFDYEYDGAGNWPFSTAYAATHADAGFVTRFRSLREAERFIKVGIPVVASVAFAPGALDGAPIGSTHGHLMVIVGFTESGDVIVNDPAAARNKGVRRTYDRGQFENAWLTTAGEYGAAGGLVYVIRDAAHPLPATRTQNW